MHQEHVVKTVEVTYEGKKVSAPYFVECGIIHAQIDGRTMALPVGRMPVETTVRTVLEGALARRHRRVTRMRNLISTGRVSPI
ncbi:hypothetical protein D9M68_820340 [compost metagenome]